MHVKNGAFYHVSGTRPRKWTLLDRDYRLALRRYAEIENNPYSPESVATFGAIAQRYRREVFPKKAFRTQKGNEAELANLCTVFGDTPIEEIKPHHVRRYLDERGKKAKTRANREKALLSHVFNHAREWGYTDAPNPCAGVKGFRERGRDRYVSDEEFRAVWEHGDAVVQDAMELAYYTGQRPGDVLSWTAGDVRDGALWIRQAKTGAALRIRVEGALARVIDRILQRATRSDAAALLQDENGRRVGYWSLRNRFDAARAASGVTFQFRDLRAKAATDLDDVQHAQKLLAHRSIVMTERYSGRRKGALVTPIARDFVEGRGEFVEGVESDDDTPS